MNVGNNLKAELGLKLDDFPDFCQKEIPVKVPKGKIDLVELELHPVEHLMRETEGKRSLLEGVSVPRLRKKKHLEDHQGHLEQGLILDLVLEDDRVEGIEGGHEDQVEVELEEDLSFHVQNVHFGIDVFTQVLEVFQLRGINVFKLGGDQKGRDSYQLQLAPRDIVFAQKTVKKVDCQKKCPSLQVEFLLDFQQPVDQNAPHLVVDFQLVVEGIQRLVLMLGDHEMAGDVREVRLQGPSGSKNRFLQLKRL